MGIGRPPWRDAAMQLCPARLAGLVVACNDLSVERAASALHRPCLWLVGCGGLRWLVLAKGR